jgi:hypothetical protein
MAYPPVPYPPSRRRPIGVTILAILIILAGIFFLLISLAALVVGTVFLGGFGLAIGVVLVILAFLTLAAGFGLLGMRPWAWWLSVIVLFLSTLSQVGSYQIGAGSLWSIAIPALILLYLLAVRKHFRRNR